MNATQFIDLLSTAEEQVIIDEIYVDISEQPPLSTPIEVITKTFTFVTNDKGS